MKFLLYSKIMLGLAFVMMLTACDNRSDKNFYEQGYLKGHFDSTISFLGDSLPQVARFDQLDDVTKKSVTQALDLTLVQLSIEIDSLLKIDTGSIAAARTEKYWQSQLKIIKFALKLREKFGIAYSKDATELIHTLKETVEMLIVN